LPSLIRKARQSPDPVTLKNIKIGTNGGTQYIDLTLQLVDVPEAIKGTIIIVFRDVEPVQKSNPRRSKNGDPTTTSRERELEAEIQRLTEELQSSREEMQTTQEELKSTNEEMQSTNEELQSTNEELTTSKEEMQSLNEELQTVNLELQSKITDFVLANNDMKNLLNSTDIATLFLDKELNIRRFTDKTTKLFKLRQSDIGRPFTDMVSDLQYPEITDHAHEVLQTLVFREIEISTKDRRWFTVRIMPYRTYDDHIDGLVITFIDNSLLKKAVNELTELKNKYIQALSHSNMVLSICDRDLRYTWMHNSDPEFIVEKVIGKRDDEIDQTEFSINLLKLKQQVVQTGLASHTRIVLQNSSGEIDYLAIASPIKDKLGKLTGVSTCLLESMPE